MGFNWINDRIPWETDLNSRAPKICEIRVSFDPVHDIGPGLDHQGFNRAPLYPVGQIVNQISDTTFDDESDDSIALGLNEAGHAEDKYSKKTEKYEKAIKDSN